MDVILIAAMAQNRTIGKDNRLPWHIPEDLQLFKKMTMGWPMIMGRRTFEAFAAPLPGRRHIVLSRHLDYQPEGAERAASLDEALHLCRGADKVFIIGGGEVFRQAISRADILILTVLQREVEGDTYFPELPKGLFYEQSRESYMDASEPFQIVTYRRTDS